MAFALSSPQNAGLNFLWYPVCALGSLAVTSLTNEGSDNLPALYALLLSVPVLSAAFCRQPRGVVFGAFGFAVGILATAVFVTVFVKSTEVDWASIAVGVPLVAAVDLAVGIAVWWCVHRRQRRRPASME